MSALAKTYADPELRFQAETRPVSSKSSRFEVITRQVEAEQQAPSINREHLPVSDDQSRVFFAIPEFRLKPAHAEQVFAATKEWEGTIESVGNSHFTAQLREVRPTASRSVDIAEIPIGDIPAGDRHLLCEGAIFRYLVGYAKSKRGTTRKRHVYFRRGRARNANDPTKRWLAIAAKFRDD